MMEYTIKKMASLSGVSARTLRYYDEIGLLQPARINLNIIVANHLQKVQYKPLKASRLLDHH